jgi:predicted transcriptional regulator
MAETIKTNFALRPETVENIEKLAEQTHRGKSDVVDWLVAEAMERILQVQRETVTVEQAIEQASVGSPS